MNFLDSDGNPVRGIVRKRIRNNEGDTVSVVNRNTLIDTIKYEVQCLDSFVEDMTSNNTAEKMLLQWNLRRMNFS